VVSGRILDLICARHFGGQKLPVSFQNNRENKRKADEAGKSIRI